MLTAAIASGGLLADFVAEDAYILLRYVRGLQETGWLQYNVGDQINALTSVLHAFLLATVHPPGADLVWSNRLLGAGCSLVAAMMVAWRYRSDTQALLLVAAVGLSTPVILWTFGGLETPLLMLLATAAALLATGRDHSANRRTGYAICVIAGLGFLTRYDAALYFAPLALWALMREPNWSHRLLAGVAGALLPIIWLALSWVQFGDLFPTSFYLKTPNPSFSLVLKNGAYIAAWLVLTGLLPAALVVAHHGIRRPEPGSGRLFLVLALAAQLAYGLTMATTHMMFSFRFFAPYLLPAAILLTASRDSAQPGGRIVILAVVCAAFHPVHAWYTRHVSLNGFSPVGEFRRLGTRDHMTEFVSTLEAHARAIEADWQLDPAQPRRPLSVVTYAGGVVPYHLPDAYVYEPLVSYRHGAGRNRQLWRYADYILTVSPLFNFETRIEPHQSPRFRLIHERRIVFDGAEQSFRVYRNLEPEPRRIGRRLDEPWLHDPATGRIP